MAALRAPGLLPLPPSRLQGSLCLWKSWEPAFENKDDLQERGLGSAPLLRAPFLLALLPPENTGAVLLFMTPELSVLPSTSLIPLCRHSLPPRGLPPPTACFV